MSLSQRHHPENGTVRKMLGTKKLVKPRQIADAQVREATFAYLTRISRLSEDA
jgi:hypothetical protein